MQQPQRLPLAGPVDGPLPGLPLCPIWRAGGSGHTGWCLPEAPPPRQPAPSVEPSQGNNSRFLKIQASSFTLWKFLGWFYTEINKLDWFLNIDELYKKGVCHLFLLRKLRSLDICSRLTAVNLPFKNWAFLTWKDIKENGLNYMKQNTCIPKSNCLHPTIKSRLLHMWYVTLCSWYIGCMD